MRLSLWKIRTANSRKGHEIMNKKTDVITNPHDQFFRESMKDKRVATEFLKTHLPIEISTLVNFNNLKLQPRSHSNAVRSESTVDVLFKTTIAEKEAYLYLLLEHQSSPDPLMSFRVIQYTINTINEHLRLSKNNTIPLIYPLVVYHGKPYEFKTNINDIVNAPKALVDQFFLKPFKLLDLNKIDDAVIKQNTWSGIMEFVLKHIFERDMLPFLREAIPLLQKIYQNDGGDYGGIVLQYALESGELNDEEKFFDLINTSISHEAGERIMSLAKKIEHRGEHKGKLEGKLEGKIEVALSMLLDGIEPVFVSKYTGLPLVKINELKKNHSSST